MLAAAAVLLFQAAPSLELTPSPRNGTAEAVARQARSLGIDTDEDNPEGEHPDPGDAQAYREAAVGPWLSSQIEKESDEIDPPPEKLRRYLRDHEDALWGVIAALQKGPPDWGRPSRIEESGGSMLLSMRVGRVVLAAALVEEREGNFIDAGRALDAIWSLGRPFAESPTLMGQLIATALEKFQDGVLRKMNDPPLQWQGRLEGNGPWEGMLESFAKEFDRTESVGGLETKTGDPAFARAMTAVAAGLRRATPCGLAQMSNDEVWRPADEEMSAETSEEKRAEYAATRDLGLVNVLNAVRRAARVEVDRELTLKVLRLRFEKEASPEHRWPDRLADTTSAVCPSADYTFQSDRSGIELRFEGPVDPPQAPPIVPLVFRSRRAEPSPTPTVAPSPTPTPTP